MEGINFQRDVPKKGDWMGKSYLKDTYLTVPIHPAHWKYRRFFWRGQAYKCTALPFGMAMAPRVFTKIVHPVMVRLREQGIRLVQYLDDILVMVDQLQRLRQHITNVSDLLTFLSASRSASLSQLEILGFLVDSQTMTISLLSTKMGQNQEGMQEAPQCEGGVSSRPGPFHWYDDCSSSSNSTCCSALQVPAKKVSTEH